jgi:uncharacterized protein DUF3182
MGMVVTYAPGHGAGQESGLREHEIASRVAVARTLAALKGFTFGGGYEPSLRRNGALYFVPSQTLSSEEARELGIHGENDLFGGVVPHAFVANKTIAHPLAGRDARRPQGWSDAFPERVRDVVLPGFAAFTREDARKGAQALLADGPVRLKRGRGIGGKGQAVIESTADLERVLGGLDARELGEHGLVVEPNLTDITTFSVGQVSVGEMRASYCGTQRATRDNKGQPAYGGSDLIVVRGEYEDLVKLNLPPQVLTAIRQAQAFDSAAAEFPGMFASRRNYDVLRGRDAQARWHCGVLEQSWRIGGASGPEVAALEAFSADPRLRAVHARSTEAYDVDANVPAGAIVHFRGVDGRTGPITKYTTIAPYERAR